MKHIGIKLADGTFYPILEEGTPATEKLDVTTVKDNQTKVQIDVYRSESGSMDDAEYVDTLEVTNLNAHPNGEPDLHLSVSLDENNELSAEVIDAETGKKSEIQVQLVSRTLAEREASDADFAIENAVSPAEIPTIEESADTTAAEEPTVAEEPFMEEAVDATDVPFSFDSSTLTDESPAPAEPKDDFDIPDFNDLAGDTEEPKHTPVSADFDLPDFGDLDLPSDTAAEEPVVEPVTDDDAFDTTAIDETAIDETALDPAAFDEAAFSESTPDDATAETAGDDEPTFADETVIADEPAFTADAASDKPAAEPAADDFGSIDLPDFDSLDLGATTSADPLAGDDFAAPAATEASESTEDPLAGSVDMPDFGDFGLGDTATSEDSSATDALSADSSATESAPDINLDDFELPDFGSSSGSSTSFDDLLFDTPSTSSSSKSGAFATSGAPAMDFSDLYDKETLEGKASSGFDDFDDDETAHKTRVPVIICVVCAIICIIATALILFIIPSKYNLIASRKAKAQKTEVVATTEETPQSGVSKLPETAPVQEPVPEEPKQVAPAVEDKIVIAPSPEEVVPEPIIVREPVTEPKKSNADVTYRIKWGDTLWDISDAYYKNPWRYPKIANYNNIPNPDLIIAGSEIVIPAE